MTMRGSSLRLRLLAGGALAIAATMLAAYFGLALLFDRHIERWAVAEMGSRVDQLMSGLRPQADGTLQLVNPPGEPRYSEPFSGIYWQVRMGERLLASPSLWDHRLPLPERPTTGLGPMHTTTAIGPLDEPLLVVGRSMTFATPHGPVEVDIAVAQETRALDQMRRDFMADLSPYVALLGCLLTLGGVVQLAVGLRPLGQIRAKLVALGSGAAQRIGDDLPVEVQPLAREIDRLLDRQADQVARARSRAADLAHVFKTPLQALMGEAARLRRKGDAAAADGIQEIADTMLAHVDRELGRARIAADTSAATDAAAIAQRVISVLRRTPDFERIDWQVLRDTDRLARIDAGDLTEALGALLENAARYAARVVRVSVTPEGGRLRIAVRDDGPGMASDAIGAARRRGVSLDPGENGSGLGLSIADEIATAAGGGLELSSDGQGFVAALVLDAAGY